MISNFSVINCKIRFEGIEVFNRISSVSNKVHWYPPSSSEQSLKLVVSSGSLELSYFSEVKSSFLALRIRYSETFFRNWMSPETTHKWSSMVGDDFYAPGKQHNSQPKTDQNPGQNSDHGFLIIARKIRRQGCFDSEVMRGCRGLILGRNGL